jgi:hypothetical protein
MGIQNVILSILVIVVISTVVGAIAKMLNNLAEAQANRRAEDERRARSERMERNAARARAAEDERAERPKPAPAAPAETHTGGTVRPASTEMDRFLAEIDRLRRKAATNPDPPAPQPGSAAPVAPVVQPIKPAAADRPRPRVVAELAEQPPPVSPPAGVGASFGTSPQAPTRVAPVAGQVEELPVAQVLRTTSSTGAPATKVTVFSKRPRPASRTNFGKNLTAMLCSGQGVAMAVVLQEILGPPKAKKNAAAHKQS